MANHLHHRRLKRIGNIGFHLLYCGNIVRSEMLLMIVNISGHGRLQPTETEIKTFFIQVGFRKRDSSGIPFGSQPLNHNAAGISKSKHLGHFIKGLAGCIVPGLAHQLKIVVG